MFNTSVGIWSSANNNINLAAEATYSVNAAAGSTVTLPELNIEEGTKGKVDWGDGTIEPFSNEGTKSSVTDDKITFSHQYASAFEGEIMLNVNEGGISGEISAAEFSKFVVLNSEKVNITKPIVFTVNESGKTVKFAPGNLYWNGSEFKFEEHQYDYPTSWDASHVGHFFWSKTTSIVYASSYNDSGKATTDTFFAADGGAIEGYTVLSKDEWLYLINHALAKNSSSKNTITIDSKECIVFKPDGFGGTVADSYTAAEWTTAESTYGLVALPFAGYRNNTGINYTGNYGNYWSSTPYFDVKTYAWRANFLNYEASTPHGERGSGYSVRLVSVQ